MMTQLIRSLGDISDHLPAMFKNCEYITNFCGQSCYFDDRFLFSPAIRWLAKKVIHRPDIGHDRGNGSLAARQMRLRRENSLFRRRRKRIEKQVASCPKAA